MQFVFLHHFPAERGFVPSGGEHRVYHKQYEPIPLIEGNIELLFRVLTPTSPTAISPGSAKFVH